MKAFQLLDVSKSGTIPGLAKRIEQQGYKGSAKHGTDSKDSHRLPRIWIQTHEAPTAKTWIHFES